MSVRFIVILVTLVGVCSACASGGSNSTPTTNTATAKHGGTATAGIDSDPSTFDPTEDATLGEEQVLVSLYDTPLQIGADGQIRPGLATVWKWDSPTRLVLTLRPGVRYTDGTPFSAQAAAFDLNRQRAKTSSYASLYASVKQISATGSNQVTITLSKPDSSLLDILAGRAAYMVSPAAVRKYGKKYGQHPVGTGPFMLSSYTPNSEVVLKRNPHYWWKGHPYLDGVTFRIITNDTTKTVAVASGELQTEDYVEPLDAPRVQGRPGVALKKWTGTLTPYIPVNYHQAPLNNPKVREAISLAIDRQSIAKNVFLGDATPTNSMLAPAYTEYDRSLPVAKADQAKARQLLGGRHLTLTMQVPPTYTNEAQVLKQQLAAVGITVNLQNMDWGTLVDNFYKNDFQLQAEDVTGQWPNAELIMGGFFLPSGEYNGLKFSDPRINTALTDAQSTSSPTTQRQDYTTAQRAAYQDDIYIPVVAVSNLRASSTRLHGVPELPDGFLDFRSAWLG